MEVNYRISINPRSDLGKVHLVQKTPVTKKTIKSCTIPGKWGLSLWPRRRITWQVTWQTTWQTTWQGWGWSLSSSFLLWSTELVLHSVWFLELIGSLWPAHGFDWMTWCVLWLVGIMHSLVGKNYATVFKRFDFEYFKIYWQLINCVELTPTLLQWQFRNLRPPKVYQNNS